MDVFTELGSNQVSQGMYGNISTKVSADIFNLNASAATLFSFSKAQENCFTALALNLSDNVEWRNRKFNFGVLYAWKPLFYGLYEQNFALLSKFRLQDFGFKLGYNIRNFRFSKLAFADYQVAEGVNASIWEVPNLMYAFSYFKSWNAKSGVECRITNFDNYVIQQETNPMFVVNYAYNTTSTMQIYQEIGYLQAGLFNIRVNYFGAYYKVGWVWKI